VHSGIDQPGEHENVVFMDGIEQFHFFILLLLKEWFCKGRPRALAEMKIMDFRLDFYYLPTRITVKSFCYKKMKVCLRFRDNAVLLSGSEHLAEIAGLRLPKKTHTLGIPG